MADIHGTCDDRFAAMRDLLSASIDAGGDVGASVCVTVDGRTVVDIWGGHADAERTIPWGEHTITNVWSTTKTVTSLCALICVERGLIDVDAPVATYWPEFAANGKEGVLVRHLMGHTSGVSGWAQPVTTEDIYDWERSTAHLAAQAPWWEPGTASGYHALNQGHLVGEVIRRVTGRRTGEFLRDEVTGPLGIDFHIGLAPSEFGRVANVIPPPPLPIDMTAVDPESVLVKTFTGPAPGAEASWTAEWRQADIGAANGHGNARSVARTLAILATGGLDGRSYLSEDVRNLVFREQANGVDLVLGAPVRFGIGFGLPNDTVPHLPQDRRVCFWGGWGGSSIVVDLDRRMTVSYMMNRMAEGLLGDARAANLVSAAFAATD